MLNIHLVRSILFCFLALIIYCVRFLVSLFFADVHKERNTHNIFEDFLEKVKTIMQTGNDTLGIPILDPFTAEKIPIEINEDMIKCILILYFLFCLSNTLTANALNNIHDSGGKKKNNIQKNILAIVQVFNKYPLYHRH